MSVRSVRRFLAMAPMAAAAVLTLAAPMSANALSVTFDSLTATGTYRLDGGSVVTETAWKDTGTAIDVLDFVYGSPSSAVLHSYGDTSGNFGTRSSGTGIYDVTGSFTISMTLSNNTSFAQSVGFDYYITPGQLSLSPFLYGTGQFAQTSATFDISVNGASKWNSAFALRADSSDQAGTATTSGDASIYSGSGLNWGVNGGQHHLDLGVLNAGESLSLTYKLTSAASGNAISVTNTTVIPAWVEVIPAHWIEYDPCDYGNEIPVVAAFAAAVTDAVDGEPTPIECGMKRELVPEQIINHDEVTQVEGSTGGSHSSTGDPFLFNLSPYFGPQVANDPNGAGFAFTSVPTGGAVPEPGALSLVALALAGAGVARRRRN